MNNDTPNFEWSSRTLKEQRRWNWKNLIENGKTWLWKYFKEFQIDNGSYKKNYNNLCKKNIFLIVTEILSGGNVLTVGTI